MRRILALTLALSVHGTAAAASTEGVSLKGSRSAMVEQNQVAKEHGLAFLRTPDQIRAAVADGQLVQLVGDANYEVTPFVSHPYVVPAVRTFVERTSAAYRQACGQKLVVTSAVRASSQQPRNASALSVHPAGMAVDLRVSDRASCREWLEATLREMKERGTANGIRERSPPHYHVAVYPEPYLAYVGAQVQKEREESASRRENAAVLARQRGLRQTVIAPVAAWASRASEAPEEAARGGGVLFSFSLTLTMGAVGGWLMLGARRPGLAGWLPRVRDRFAHRGR